MGHGQSFLPLSSKFDLFHIYRTAESMLLTTIAIIHSLKCLFRSTPPSSDSTPWYTPIYSYGFITKCSRSAKRHISTSVGRTGLFAPLSLDFWWFLPPCTTSPVSAMCVSPDYWHWSQLTYHLAMMGLEGKTEGRIVEYQVNAQCLEI